MGEPNCVNGKCLIQGGTFMMGSPAGVGDPDEHPQKQVTVTTFRMGQTEVSLGEFKKYFYSKYWEAFKSGNIIRMAELSTTRTEMSKDYCGQMNGKGDDYPVVCLTMPEKEDYCHAQGGELMTAAQFEYAARFDAQDARADQLVVWENGQRTTVPVRSGYQNRFGVFNLLGNVWESMRDAYEKAFYARMPGTDPYNPMTNPYDYRTNPQGQLEEFRGGSFGSGAWFARAANRGFGPGGRGGVDGFRCVWPQDSK